MTRPSDEKLTSEQLRAWLDRKPPEEPADERDWYELLLPPDEPRTLLRHELLEAGHA